MTIEDIAVEICRDVAELPDRTSPDEWPEAMLVTHEELNQIVTRNLTASGLEIIEKGELERLRGDGWQDISTAPKDGTQIDLLMHSVRRPDPEWIRYTGAWWQGDQWYYWFGMACIACDFFGEAPTHWRQIPKPPVSPTPPREGE